MELLLEMYQFCIFGNEFLADIPTEHYGELCRIANAINSHDLSPAKQLMFDLFTNGVWTARGCGCCWCMHEGFLPCI